MLTAMTNMLLRATVRRWFENDSDVRQTRRKLDRFTTMFDAPPRGWSAKAIGGAGGGELFMIAAAEPLAAGAGLMLYFHGGGYSVGSVAGYLPFCARIGAAIGAPVMFAAYRLAPEHPFPAAFDDGVAAYAQAAATARGRLVVAGDSAGGGLALAVVQAALAGGMRAPDALILLSPWADLTLSGRSMNENAASDAMLSAKALTRMRGAYLNGADPADRRASPLLDPNTRLPPTLLVYSRSEVLAADAVRLAAKLKAGGTEVTEFAVHGAPHVFPLFRTVPDAAGAIEAMRRFVGK